MEHSGYLSGVQSLPIDIAFTLSLGIGLSLMQTILVTLAYAKTLSIFMKAHSWIILVTKFLEADMQITTGLPTKGKRMECTNSPMQMWIILEHLV